MILFMRSVLGISILKSADLNSFSHILSLKVVTGAYDFMATAIARDLEDYGRLIDELLGLKSVDNVESL
ncbi:MAG: Lrp/AsnC ligand binding domain-containing protein, partial [Bacteroidota bacterium]